MSIINNQTNIYTSPTLEPNFNWQVGFNNFNTVTSGVNFRVTVRPINNLEQFTRVPNPNVVFEETGVVLNGSTNLGLWQFTFAKNLLSTGGPYRDYQVVVEAHDSDGNTSAGNVIGTYGNNENGWTAYPNGYDIVAIKNPRPSGIELSNNIPTQDTATGAFNFLTGNNYETTQYMGSNGEIIIRYDSGVFPSGIVGGYLYTSATPFPKRDIFSPTSSYGSRVEQTRFSFDSNNPFIYCPHAAFNVRGAPYCYVSVSFYDEIDDVLINNGINVSTGLYMSNNALFYNDSAAGSLTLNGIITIHSVQTTGYPSPGTIATTNLIGINSIEITRTSLSGSINLPGNITTIVYASLPVTGLYTGISNGSPGGIGGDSTTNITGRTPGGYGTGTLVAVGFTSGSFGTGYINYKSISQLKVGDTVLSYVFPPLTGQDILYSSLIDNWQTTRYSLTGILSPSNVSGNFVSGIITNIGSSIKSNYIQIDKGDLTNPLEITFEQPIFMFTGRTSPSNLTGRFLDGITISTGVLYQAFVNPGNDGELMGCSVNFNGDSLIMFRQPINLTNFPPAIFNTGLFYYMEVKPYNVFFVTNSGSFGHPPLAYMTHNSLYTF